MNPEVSEFKILENEDNGQMDFFYHHDIHYAEQNLFEE